MPDLTPKAKQIYLYDYYEKLRNNLNRIKQLQLFAIDKYSVDYAGNQWFLYKPKWNLFTKTDNSQVIYNFPDPPAPEDISLNEIKESENVVSDFKNTPGELWVRLKNLPFAYPISYNILTKVNQTLWYKVLSGEIYKFDIFENFGYILYKAKNQYSIIVFTIENAYDDQIYLFNESTNYKEILDWDVWHDSDHPDGLDEVTSINRRIIITPIKSFTFSTSEVLIDIISHSGAFYVLYYDRNELVANQTINIAKIDQTRTGLVEKAISPTSTVTLPQYVIGSTNVCRSLADGNWTVSVSADNVNIAYESIPLD